MSAYASDSGDYLNTSPMPSEGPLQGGLPKQLLQLLKVAGAQMLEKLKQGRAEDEVQIRFPIVGQTRRLEREEFDELAQGIRELIGRDQLSIKVETADGSYFVVVFGSSTAHDLVGGAFANLVGKMVSNNPRVHHWSTGEIPTFEPSRRNRQPDGAWGPVDKIFRKLHSGVGRVRTPSLILETSFTEDEEHVKGKVEVWACMTGVEGVVKVLIDRTGPLDTSPGISVSLHEGTELGKALDKPLVPPGVGVKQPDEGESTGRKGKYAEDDTSATLAGEDEDEHERSGRRGSISPLPDNITVTKWEHAYRYADDLQSMQPLGEAWTFEPRHFVRSKVQLIKPEEMNMEGGKMRLPQELILQFYQSIAITYRDQVGLLVPEEEPEQ